MSPPRIHLAIFHSEWFRLEQVLLLERLKYVKTGYDLKLQCMEGTREGLLKQVIGWATNEPGQEHKGNTFWIYGGPGIGKTSLAHSICVELEKRERLAGAFFAERMTWNCASREISSRL